MTKATPGHGPRRRPTLRAMVRLALLGLVASTAAWLAGSQPVRAEEPSPIKWMKISLWPEYDDPRLLVMLEGEYDASVSFPRKVRFRLPKGAEVNQVCALKKPADEHLCQLYETQVEGDSVVLTYTLPIPTFFLEFYYDTITGNPNKAFAYVSRSFDHIDQLDVEVQQPLKATDFQLEPAAEGVRTSSDGFKNYRYNFTDVASEQPITLKASYVKTDPRPSVSKEGTSSSGSTTGSSNSTLLWGVGGAVAVGVGILGLVTYRNRQLPPAPASARATGRRGTPTPRAPSPAPTPRSRRTGGPPEPGRATFCSQCGSRLDPEDNFCPNCGTQIERRR